MRAADLTDDHVGRTITVDRSRGVKRATLTGRLDGIGKPRIGGWFQLMIRFSFMDWAEPIAVHRDTEVTIEETT